MPFDEYENEFLDFRFGPFRMGIGAFLRPFKVSYSRTKDSHILRLRLNPELKKEDLKVRLLKGGILEIEWPMRLEEGEEVEVE
ncbi:MAG: hypothetical protein ACOYU0_04240 [Nitrospirota bacterium]